MSRAVRITAEGSSRHSGRPSSTPKTALIARPSAQTYREADARATTVPTMSAVPAAGVVTSVSIGPRTGSRISGGATSESMSMTASTVRSPWPNTPSSDTTTRTAGNSESTP